MVVLAASLLLIAAACDWPMFRYGADRTGFSPDVSVSKGAVASGSMVLDWASSVYELDSSPVLANGKVYTAGRSTGSSVLTLRAFDASGNAGTVQR